MSVFSTDNPWAIAFGLLGNFISFIVFLAPIPTFMRVYRKKSTEGFQPFPYLIALFSAALWIYYAALQSQILLITINSLGCVFEVAYIGVYIAFAPKKSKILTLKLLVLMNLGAFSLIFVLSQFLAKGPTRIKVIGWLSVCVGVSVFAAPLSIMRVVIRTKSVEFMPLPLSFFLTLSAVIWLFYGIFLKDIYVTLPNILGLAFGAAQMILYVIYRKKKPTVADEKKLPQLCKTDLEMMSLNEIQKNADPKPIINEEDEPNGPIELRFHPTNPSICRSMDMIINQGQQPIMIACQV